MTKKTTSPLFWIDKVGLKKLGKGTLIAGASAALAYLGGNLGLLDLGSQWTPIVVAVLSVLINAVRKALVKYE